MKRVLSLILILVLLLPMLPERIVATTPNTANTQRATAPFPVDYDPNEGVINYGHSGTVGMKKENDTNNNYDEDDRYVHFPDDVAKADDYCCIYKIFI